MCRSQHSSRQGEGADVIECISLTATSPHAAKKAEAHDSSGHADATLMSRPTHDLALAHICTCVYVSDARTCRREGTK